MKINKDLLIISLLAFMVSCESSPIAMATLIAPERLAIGADKKVEGYESALASYASFSKKAKRSEPLCEKGNSVYSPFSHYLALATAYSAMVGLTQEQLAPFGVETPEELAEVADKLIRLETLVNEYPENGTVEATNLIANFGKTWPEEKIDFLVEKLHAAYLSGYSGHQEAIAKWQKEVSYGMVDNPFIPSLLQGESYFLNGLYIDLPFGTYLNEKTEERPFGGKGSYPFLVGITSGKLFRDDEEVLAFSQKFRPEGYEIRYVMPKNADLESYLKKNDVEALFEDKPLLAGQFEFELPSLQISDDWQLERFGKDLGIEPGVYRFLENGTPYEILQMQQSMAIRFEYNGVKAYSNTQIVMIPTSEPYEVIKLNRPFGFDIVGREGVTLIHGRVRTLDD